MKINNAKSVCPKILTGTVYSDDGAIFYAKLKMRHGRWDVKNVDSWPASNILKTAHRLSGGAVLGLCAKWRRDVSGCPALELSTSETNADINPYFNAAECGAALEVLSGNITFSVVEDSFLLTLPLAFGGVSAPSFLSAYSENGLVTFGVIIAKKIDAVFSFPCASPSCMEASAARVKRYWRHTLKRDDFPQEAFVWGLDGQNGNCDGLNVNRLALPPKLNDGGTLKAAGVALAAVYPVQTFGLPPRYSFRIYRLALLKFSALLLCLSLITASIFTFANIYAGMKLAQNEKMYHSRLNENKALQNLSKTADELSNKILSAQKTYTQFTNWGNFLLLLGEIKPDGLFFDRMGADNAQGQDNSVRIALSGWSHTETSVTEFISGLQAVSYVNNVSLSSIERDAKNKNICRFRILCTMQLFKN